MRAKLLPVSVTVVSLFACGSSTVATRPSGDDTGSQQGGTSDTTGGLAGSSIASGASGASSAGNATGAGGSAGTVEAGSIGGRGCAGLALCDDFESVAVDGPPDASKWKVGAPNVTGTGTLAIDGTRAHRGTKSVRVNGKDSYNNHIFFYNESAVAGIGKVLFGRMFVRFAQPLADGHAAFLAMKDTGDMKDFRMGSQDKVLDYNRELGDSTLPSLSPAGVATSVSPLPNAWLCIELEIDGNTGEIQTWIDGKAIAGLHADGSPTPDIDQQWVSLGYKPSLTDVKFGWESYGAGDMTLWFDDVALDAQRIGCD